MRNTGVKEDEGIKAKNTECKKNKKKVWVCRYLYRCGIILLFLGRQKVSAVWSHLWSDPDNPFVFIIPWLISEYELMVLLL